MVNQIFKEGDIVSIRGQVKYCFDGKVGIQLADYHSTQVEVAAVTMVFPNFKVGDDVVTETGEPYTIAAIYRDFAWVFSTVDGFDTVELASLKRADPDTDPATDPDFIDPVDEARAAASVDLEGSE